MSEEPFERKPYFYSMNLESVRMKFRISSHMVQTIRKNFRSKYKHASLRCPSCKDFPTIPDARNSSTQEEENTIQGSFCQQKANDEDFPLDSQHHLIYDCPAFRKNRLGKDMTNDQHLVEIFKEIIEYRLENNQDWIYFWLLLLKYAAAARCVVQLSILSLVAWTTNITNQVVNYNKVVFSISKPRWFIQKYVIFVLVIIDCIL